MKNKNNELKITIGSEALKIRKLMRITGNELVIAKCITRK